MISLLLKMLGDPNEKKVKKILGIIDHINSLEPEFEKLSDPWLDRFDNENHIEFNSYLKEVEYWETYAEVLQGQ